MNAPQHPKFILRTLMASAAALALAAGFSSAQSTDDSAITDFSSFQIIPQRNIFDPNRYPHERPNYHHERSQGVPTFSLAGTMSYRRGMFAFFDGTDSEYQEAVQVGGTIAGFTVTNITMDGVQLLSGGKTIDLKVGSAMQQDGDSWDLNDNAVVTMPDASSPDNGRDNSSAPSPSTNVTPVASPDAGGGDGNDVLKRLMQQRQQELK